MPSSTCRKDDTVGAIQSRRVGHLRGTLRAQEASRFRGRELHLTPPPGRSGAEVPAVQFHEPVASLTRTMISASETVSRSHSRKRW